MIRTPTFAGRFERLLANLVDTFLLFVPAVLLASAGGTGSPLALIGGFLCNVAYYTAFTSGQWQATPGKRLFNLYVVKLNGQKLSQRDALERFLGYIIPSLPLYLTRLPEGVIGTIAIYLSLAWFAPVLFRPDRAALHDLLCRTRVVVGRL